MPRWGHTGNKQKRTQPGLGLTTAAGNSKKGQNPTINYQCTATTKPVSNTTTRGGLPLDWASAPVEKQEKNTKLTQSTVWGPMRASTVKRRQKPKYAIDQLIPKKPGRKQYKIETIHITHKKRNNKFGLQLRS